jgi:hypothetical protein
LASCHRRNAAAGRGGLPVVIQWHIWEIDETGGRMRSALRHGSIGISLVATLTSGAGPGARAQGGGAWIREFAVDKRELRSTGRNPYFVLEPGYAIVLENGAERVTKTVLNETRIVDGVETRVVEERETKDGTLVEISRNFFAIHARSKDVFYFGEEVDMYKDGKVVSHEGAWLSGVKGARFGLMMPGEPRVRAAFYEEIAPGVAMDRATIVSVSEAFTSPAGAFSRCVKTEETSPLEPGAREYKVYAPGIGQVLDGSLVLVRYGGVPMKRG